MKYRVIILPAAELDITLAAAWLAQHNPEHARRWVVEVHRAITSLSEFPARCRVVRASEFPDLMVRRLLYGRRRSKYRILFSIRGDLVEVLRVRHAARRSGR